jgi:hypothetical protein
MGVCNRHIHGADITLLEQALVDGEVGELDYADQAQHARIHAIEKMVKDLRDSCDLVWKADMLAVGQRAINAVCSLGRSQKRGEHAVWATASLTTFKEEGVSCTHYGDYQMRLEIYHRMVLLYKERLFTSYHNGFDTIDDDIPDNFKRNDTIRAMCHARGIDCGMVGRERS